MKNDKNSHFDKSKPKRAQKATGAYAGKKDRDFKHSRKASGAYAGKKEGDFKHSRKATGAYAGKKEGDFKHSRKAIGAYAGKKEGDFKHSRKASGAYAGKKEGDFNHSRKATGAYAGKDRDFSRRNPKAQRAPNFRDKPTRRDFRPQELKFILQTKQEDSEKLQKVLAAYGLGSRRTMEEKIQLGHILVNGEVAQLGARVSAKDKIMLDGKELESQIQARRLLIYNKPEGELVTRYDEEGRDLVFSRLPHLPIGRWIPVGRLDINTSGLLLLTNDGELADALTHPSSEMEREYMVRVLGRVSDSNLEKLKRGVALEDGMASFSSIEALKMKAEEAEEVANSWFKVKLKEGRNRLVRRLWESLGFNVSRLKRINFGGIHLNREDKVGRWRELSTNEIAELSNKLGLKVEYADAKQTNFLSKIMRMDKKLVKYKTKNQLRDEVFTKKRSRFDTKTDNKQTYNKKNQRPHTKAAPIPKVQLGRNRPPPKQKLIYKNPKLDK